MGTHKGQYTLALQLNVGGHDQPLFVEGGEVHGLRTIWSALDRVVERFKADIDYQAEQPDGYDWRVEAERRQRVISTLRDELDELREEHESVVREFDVVVDERDAALLKLEAYERAVEGNKVAG